MEPKIERLDAEDAEGQRTQVLRITRRINMSSLDGPGSRDGQRAYKALDGEHLNVEGDELVALHSGRRFRLT